MCFCGTSIFFCTMSKRDFLHDLRFIKCKYRFCKFNNVFYTIKETLFTQFQDRNTLCCNVRAISQTSMNKGKTYRKGENVFHSPLFVLFMIAFRI